MYHYHYAVSGYHNNAMSSVSTLNELKLYVAHERLNFFGVYLVYSMCVGNILL
jgi:hypothetical protein